MSVDTWAVDYVLLRGEEEVRPVYAYRDSRTPVEIPLSFTLSAADMNPAAAVVAAVWEWERSA